MSKASTKSFKERALSKPGPKQKVNSRAKGGRNEREIANVLSKWTGEPFRRTPMSGGIHVAVDFLCGDVFCANKYFDFVFSIETKHYHTISSTMALKFFEQAMNDADRIKKYPLLLIRENGYPKGLWLAYLNVGRNYMLKNNIPHILAEGPGGNDGCIYRLSSTDLFSIPYKEFSIFLTNDSII